jgi:hypothetical protein
VNVESRQQRSARLVGSVHGDPADLCPADAPVKAPGEVDFDGQERSPMRLAEARITLGGVRAQEGDLDAAIEHGTRALQGKRKSLPTLLMASRDLTKILNDRYSA